MKKDYFDKNASSAIKGIVIILMLAHHLFRVPSLYEGFEICFTPFGEDFINKICTYFKLCVGAFAFITGYGLSKSLKNDSSTYSKFFLARYVKSFFPFWILFIIIVTATQLIDGTSISFYFKEGANIFQGILYILLDFLGLSVFTKTPRFMAEWWYMGACILFILLVPIFKKMIEKYGAIAAIGAVVLIPRVLNVGFLGGINPLSFLMAPLLGVIFEKYDLFAKINEFTVPITKNKYVRKILTFILFAAVWILSIEFYHGVNAKYVWEINYAVVPVIFIVFINRYALRWSIVKRIFAYVGLHSASMYITHMFAIKYLGKYIYKMPYFMLSVLFLFAITLVFSILLELIKKLTRINKLEKLMLSKIR